MSVKNFILPEAYVSPTVREVKIKAMRVVCASPTYGSDNAAGYEIIIDNGGNDIEL